MKLTPSRCKPLAGNAPVGTPVILVEDAGNGVTFTATRSEPWALGDGTRVVLVHGRSGGYQLSRCFDATDLMKHLGITGADVHFG